MLLALAEAEEAAASGEVPVGAALVDAKGRLLGQIAQPGRSLVRSHRPCRNPGAARSRARRAVRPRLEDCDLYVTLEPCAICAAAISFARIRRLYFGAYDPKMGAVEHGPKFFQQPTCHHRPEIYGGIEESRAGELLRRFFARRR